jgi:hypothetical protein
MIGFVIAGVAILTFGWLLYRMEQKKRNDTPSHHVIILEEFPVLNVPVAIPLKKAQTIAENLRHTYTGLWAAFNAIYGSTKDSMPISVIGCTMDDVDPDHKHIRWMAPTDRFQMKIEPDMYYWFARECHNVYRYLVNGINGIYYIKNDDDASHARDAGRWIEDNIGRNDEG